MTVEEQDPLRREVHPGKFAHVLFDPERTFDCVPECTWCCHHGVLLYEQDLHELAKREPLPETTESVNAWRYIPTESKARDAHTDPDGEACRFLNADGLCHLHAEHDWKPTRCSVFPLHIEVRDGDLYVDVREEAEQHCEGMDVGGRRLIDNLEAFLPPGLWEEPNPSTDIVI